MRSDAESFTTGRKFLRVLMAVASAHFGIMQCSINVPAVPAHVLEPDSFLAAAVARIVVIFRALVLDQKIKLSTHCTALEV